MPQHHLNHERLTQNTFQEKKPFKALMGCCMHVERLINLCNLFIYEFYYFELDVVLEIALGNIFVHVAESFGNVYLYE